MLRAVAAAAGLAALAGCETFEEIYTVEQEVIINRDGIRVVGDLEEDFFGSRWWQFRAYNSNSFDVCVQVSLENVAYTSGHSMGGIHKLGPGGAADVGYVNEPADFGVDARVFNVNANGVCS